MWLRRAMVVCGAAFALLVAGCSGTPGANPDQVGPAGPGHASDNTAATQAASLRAELTTLFLKRDSLAAYTTHAAVQDGMEAARAKAGADALHDGDAVLLRKITAATGDVEHRRDRLKRLERLLEERTTALLDYIAGAAGDDPVEKQDAERHLHLIGKQIGGLVEELTDEVVSVEDAHGMLAGHLALATMAIDAIAAGDPSAPADVADLTPPAKKRATVLARGFAVSSATVPGDAIAGGATLRARLTGLFVAHAAQTVLLAQAVAVEGPDSAAAKTAAESLRKSSDDLAALIEETYGSSTADRFSRLADEHLSRLISYVKADGQDGDYPKKDAQALAEFFDKITDGAANEPELTQALSERSSALKQAIDAIVAQSPTAANKIEHAESLAADPARILAIGIVHQYPKQYST